MKLVVDRASDQVVGCHMVGDGAGEAVQLLGIAVKAGATKAQFDASVGIGRRIADACGARGLIVRPIGRLNVLSPPLILTTGQIDWLVDTLRVGIEEVMADLVREGLWREKV